MLQWMAAAPLGQLEVSKPVWVNPDFHLPFSEHSLLALQLCLAYYNGFGAMTWAFCAAFECSELQRSRHIQRRCSSPIDHYSHKNR